MRRGNNYSGARPSFSQRPSRVLTPVTITATYPTGRSGRREAWAAKSDDGLWTYHRLEMSTSPWATEHVSSGLEADWQSTLDDARAATADGTALTQIDKQLASEGATR
jgi:hypothetical protein